MAICKSKSIAIEDLSYDNNFYELQETNIDSDSFINFLANRRSIRNFKDKEVPQEILQQIISNKDTKTCYYKIIQKDLYEGNEFYIRLTGNIKKEDDFIQKLLSKLNNQGITLSHLCNVNQGILTGADKVSEKHIRRFPNAGFLKGEGIFVLNKHEVKKITSKELLKPWFKNSDIYKYFTKTQTQEYLLYLTRDLELSDYKDIQSHIFKFEKIIKARPKNRGEIQAALKQGKWWVIFAARKGIPFDKAKIVVPQRSKTNTFGYNEIPWYASADVYFITDKDETVSLKYILALLNSKIYYLWFYYKGKKKGETLELYHRPLSETPIKKVSYNKQRPFINLVDKILSLTQSENYLENPQKQAKVKEYERQIDQLVYKLYNLTEEEIKIVEDFEKNKL